MKTNQILEKAQNFLSGPSQITGLRCHALRLAGGDAVKVLSGDKALVNSQICTLSKITGKWEIAKA